MNEIDDEKLKGEDATSVLVVGAGEAGRELLCSMYRDPQRGRAAGRSSRTRSLTTVIPRSQPTRSAITVAGIVGNACNCSRIRGSNASTADRAGFRTYLGGLLGRQRGTHRVPRDAQRSGDHLDRQPSVLCSRRI